MFFLYKQSVIVNLRRKTFICAAMTNQQLIDSGNKIMDETDESIERSKQVASK